MLLSDLVDEKVLHVLANLVEIFTLKEIRAAVFQMKKNKEPGPDGLPIEFYQPRGGRPYPCGDLEAACLCSSSYLSKTASFQ